MESFAIQVLSYPLTGLVTMYFHIPQSCNDLRFIAMVPVGITFLMRPGARIARVPIYEEMSF